MFYPQTFGFVVLVLLPKKGHINSTCNLSIFLILKKKKTMNGIDLQSVNWLHFWE